MLDIRLLRDNLEQVKRRMETRGIVIDWEEFVSLDRERRGVLSRLEIDARARSVLQRKPAPMPRN
jgi:seryl-tRNA synthetase